MTTSRHLQGTVPIALIVSVIDFAPRAAKMIEIQHASTDLDEQASQMERNGIDLGQDR